MKQAIMTAALLLSNVAIAQTINCNDRTQVLTDAYRQQCAVAFYDFAETSGRILDKSRAISPHSQVDLELYTSGGTQRLPDTSVSGATHYIKLDAPNLIRSVGPASKITSTCKSTGSLSFEVWLENNESVQKRAGFDSTDDNNRRPHPLRILNLSVPSASDTSTENLYRRNFVFGQFYEMGNLYQTAVRTPTSESGTNYGRSLTTPLESTVAQTIVPDPVVGRTNPTLQKVVYTLGPSGVARLYLSDLNGRLYQAGEQADGFLGNSSANPSQFFSNWFDNAYLSIGNVYMRNSEFATALQQPDLFGETCTNCENNKNRFWKGKLRKVTIFCSELSREQVLGAGSVTSVIQNTTNFTISTAAAPNDLRLKALEIHSRLTGIKTASSDPIIDQMEQALAAGDEMAAAGIATQDSRFLNITVRDFAAKMSNRDQSVNVPLNDFIATVVGATRDDLDARRLLYDNLTYVADPSLAPVPSDLISDILRSNNHYQALDDGRYDLERVLVQQNRQYIFNGTASVENPSPAGLLTSRQWLSEHAIAGTNRRLVEYSFKIFLCSPIESIADASGPEEVIGPDIDRVPGGSATKFQTNCRACHTILDGFRPAFARWTFGSGFAKHAFAVPALAADADENADSPGMQINPMYPRVTAKINRNSDVYPDARRVVDEKWVNNAIYNANAINLAFDKTKPQYMSGTGTQSFGRTLASSPKFARCMAERVFRQVCKRDVVNSDNSYLNEAATQFSNTTNNYNLKFLFQKIVTSDNCLGGQ